MPDIIEIHLGITNSGFILSCEKFLKEPQNVNVYEVIIEAVMLSTTGCLIYQPKASGDRTHLPHISDCSNQQVTCLAAIKIRISKSVVGYRKRSEEAKVIISIQEFLG